MKDLDVDIIAPFYCSFIHRVMSDAVKQNIQRLYFCARDTFQLYQIAQIMKPLFPSLELKYINRLVIGNLLVLDNSLTKIDISFETNKKSDGYFHLTMTKYAFEHMKLHWKYNIFLARKSLSSLILDYPKGYAKFFAT